MTEELNLKPQHRTAEQIAVAIVRREKDRDDMAVKAKASAQGFKGIIDKIEEDISQLREEFHSGQLALLADGLGMKSHGKRD